MADDTPGDWNFSYGYVKGLVGRRVALDHIEIIEEAIVTAVSPTAGGGTYLSLLVRYEGQTCYERRTHMADDNDLRAQYAAHVRDTEKIDLSIG